MREEGEKKRQKEDIILTERLTRSGLDLWFSSKLSHLTEFY